MEFSHFCLMYRKLLLLSCIYSYTSDLLRHLFGTVNYCLYESLPLGGEGGPRKRWMRCFDCNKHSNNAALRLHLTTACGGASPQGEAYWNEQAPALQCYTSFVLHINNNLLLNFTLDQKAPSDEGAVSEQRKDDFYITYYLFLLCSWVCLIIHFP